MLQEKFVVAKLSGAKEKDDSILGEAAARILGTSVGDIDLSIYWHIAAHSFSPYQSTFRVMEWKGQTQQENQVEVLLEASLLNLIYKSKLGMRD